MSGVGDREARQIFPPQDALPERGQHGAQAFFQRLLSQGDTENLGLAPGLHPEEITLLITQGILQEHLSRFQRQLLGLIGLGIGQGGIAGDPAAQFLHQLLLFFLQCLDAQVEFLCGLFFPILTFASFLQALLPLGFQGRRALLEALFLGRQIRG